MVGLSNQGISSIKEGYLKELNYFSIPFIVEVWCDALRAGAKQNSLGVLIEKDSHFCSFPPARSDDLWRDGTSKYSKTQFS